MFQQANAILRATGKRTADLNAISFNGLDFRINNSIANEDWDVDFERLADNIRDFVDKSCDVAGQLDELLAQVETSETIGQMCKQG